MKVEIVNHRDRTRVEISLGNGSINSMTVAAAIELHNKLGEQLRACQLLHAADSTVEKSDSVSGNTQDE